MNTRFVLGFLLRFYYVFSNSRLIEQLGNELTGKK